MTFDSYEVEILKVLQKEGRMSNVDLASRIGLSESPALRKTRQLESSGVITGYRAMVDPKKIGCLISAVIMVNLERTDEAMQDFLADVQNEARVIECLAVAGTSDLMLRVVARDIEDLSELTLKGLLSKSSVKDFSSFIVLKEFKSETPLPVL